MPIGDRVDAVLRRQLGSGPRWTDCSTLAEDLGFESLDMVELAVGLETEFGCALPDDELCAFRTVEHLKRWAAGECRPLLFAS